MTPRDRSRPLYNLTGKASRTSSHVVVPGTGRSSEHHRGDMSATSVRRSAPGFDHTGCPEATSTGDLTSTVTYGRNSPSAYITPRINKGHLSTARYYGRTKQPDGDHLGCRSVTRGTTSCTAGLTGNGHDYKG